MGYQDCCTTNEQKGKFNTTGSISELVDTIGVGASFHWRVLYFSASFQSLRRLAFYVRNELRVRVWVRVRVMYELRSKLRVIVWVRVRVMYELRSELRFNSHLTFLFFLHFNLYTALSKLISN